MGAMPKKYRKYGDMTRFSFSNRDRVRAFLIPRISLACATILLLASSPVSAASEFQHVVTANYDIRVRGNAGLTRKIASHMETLISRYQEIFEDLHNKPKARVVVLKDKEQYIKYLVTQPGPVREKSLGITRGIDTSEGPVIEMVSYLQPDLFSVLSHEGFHQFLFLHMEGKAPVWLNEGLAQYFESVGKVKIKSKKKYSARAQAVIQSEKRKDLLPWLLNLGNDEFYREGDKAYPLAWALVRYLAGQGGQAGIQPAFRKYMEDIRRGKPAIPAFRKRFGKNLKATQKDWMHWIKKR
jgi:hypothetical protein